MGFFGWLTLALIVLKLTGFIAWSWTTVILGPLAIWLAIVVLTLVGVFSLLK